MLYSKTAFSRRRISIRHRSSAERQRMSSGVYQGPDLSHNPPSQALISGPFFPVHPTGGYPATDKQSRCNVATNESNGQASQPALGPKPKSVEHWTRLGVEHGLLLQLDLEAHVLLVFPRDEQALFVRLLLTRTSTTHTRLSLIHI